MNIVVLDNKTSMEKPCVATIGFFDGVHRGHKYLISHVIDEAEADGLKSMVITFDKHPRQVLQSDYIPEMLSTLDDKLQLLSKTGVDEIVVMHFDVEMASLSAEDFMQKVLKDRLNVKKLVIGYDNRFGHNREEGFDDYVRYGRKIGIEVVHNQALEVQGMNVSSSVVRRLIRSGEVEMAEACLGYPYAITGEVVRGFQEGRKLGFPTANLDTSKSGQMIPAPGVYAVRACLKTDSNLRPGMMNIGTRPTFYGDRLTLETNIFDFDEDIYGKQLTVSFVHRIREERKFDSPEMLAEQLKKDRNMVEEQFKKENEI